MKLTAIAILIVSLASCNEDTWKVDGSLDPVDHDTYILNESLPEEELESNFDGLTPLKASLEEDRPLELSDTKIIKTAHLDLQVKQLDSLSNVIEKRLKDFQAYSTQFTQSDQGSRITTLMTIRVPPAQLDPLLAFLVSHAEHVNSREVTSKDVTEEYVDIKNRLENKRHAEQRFREILAEANNVKDILIVEDHIRKIREEIESAEGRLNYLSHQSRLSTIQLIMYEPVFIATKAPGQSYKSRLGEAFSGGWQFLKHLTLGIIYIWPLWILLISIYWLVIIRKRQLRQKAT